ncbi:MAG: DNA translocase FtsK [Anaerolineae bacterium]|nr:DNA translocase FtsK [Anaerolineae bacterium]
MTKRSTSSKRKSSSSSRTSRSRSRRTTKKPQPVTINLSVDQQLDIIGGLLIFIAALTLLSFLSAQQGSLTEIWLSFLANTFGWGMYALPFFLGAFGLWLILRRFGDRIPWPTPAQVGGIIFSFFIALVTMHLITHWLWPEVDIYSFAETGEGGGLIGAALLDAGLQALGAAGVAALLLMAWLMVATLISGVSPAGIIRKLVVGEAAVTQETQMPVINSSQRPTNPAPQSESEPMAESRAVNNNHDASRNGRKKDEGPTINIASRPGNGEVDIENISPAVVGTQSWRLPDVKTVLEPGSEQDYSENLIREQVKIIEETLESLSAPATVVEVNQGPVVTQFGVEPLFLTTRSGKTTKVKVSKIASLADDLALALAARSIRIEAPIPGKGLVGVEVPNMEPAIVALRDVMESQAFSAAKGRVRLGLGQDVSGQAIVADLRAMPHLLIAGATGAGKSVCVNALIAALLLQNSPDTLRLMMVDPKRVELTQYNGIPHLLTPVITDVERVVPALRWVMREMDSRYRRFAQAGARNIEDFNRRAPKIEDGAAIPYIAVIIDELADLMMQSPEETERVICRLAQMARATGIHLIIATQRPSVDVVTGLIKANFPSRIAFAVASSIDSRVILDTPGAERLLGQGDMLFMPPDAGQPLRLQGVYVSDHELNSLIKFWRDAVEPGKSVGSIVIPGARSISTPLGETMQQAPLLPDFNDQEVAQQFEDPLLPQAVEILLAENRASISLLQRRLRIGYTRSARLVELLTDMGIVTHETQGQSRGINRAVAESLLRSLNPEPTG